VERFSYSWRDFSLAGRNTLSVRAWIASFWLLVAGLVSLAALLWATGAERSVYAAISWLLGVQIAPSASITNGAIKALVFIIALSCGWLVLTRTGTRLSRLAACDICQDKRVSGSAVKAYVQGYARYAGRMPIALLVFALPSLAVLAIWWGISMIPFVGIWIAAIGSPLALVFAMWIGLQALCIIPATPLHIASIGVRGGDTYESFSRVSMYLSMSPFRALWWGILAVGNSLLLGFLALVITILGATLMGFLATGLSPSALALLTDVILGVAPTNANPDVLDPATARSMGTVLRILIVLVPAAFAMSAWHANCVIWYLLLRWHNDGAPVNEFFDPREALEVKATEMEREQAKKSLGLTQAEDASAVESKPDAANVQAKAQGQTPAVEASAKPVSAPVATPAPAPTTAPTPTPRAATPRPASAIPTPATPSKVVATPAPSAPLTPAKPAAPAKPATPAAPSDLSAPAAQADKKPTAADLSDEASASAESQPPSA